MDRYATFGWSPDWGAYPGHLADPQTRQRGEIVALDGPLVITGVSGGSYLGQNGSFVLHVGDAVVTWWHWACWLAGPRWWDTHVPVPRGARAWVSVANYDMSTPATFGLRYE